MAKTFNLKVKIIIKIRNWFKNFPINFCHKLKFLSKNGISNEQKNFGNKNYSGICAILAEEPKLGRKLKFWLLIDILVRNLYFGRNRNFGRKSEFWSKIGSLVENRKFGRKSEFWVKNRNFGRKSKFWSRIGILVENRK